ncbi:hypothetical protein GCM10023191_062080 [Actinoallomurus oryzae]|uniref:Uncharacterized protein n=1 Tax=Actinoallomurus oryzae TaxID=502180 RepID=A0ABP8QLK7_9ACTN
MSRPGEPSRAADGRGPPDPALPDWNKTRDADRSSWQAASDICPNAASGSSIQA